MEGFLLPSVTPTPQLQIKLEERWLPAGSGSSILLGVDLNVKTMLQASLNSQSRGNLSGQSQRAQGNRKPENQDSICQIRSNFEPIDGFRGRSRTSIDNRRVFDRLSDVEEAGPKVGELRKQQGWNDALLYLEDQLEHGRSVPADDFAHLLLHCCDTEDGLARCHQLQKYIILSGHGSNVFLHNNLVESYSKCGSLITSCMVFNGMSKRNVFSWTAIILAHVKHGQDETAVLLFRKMLETGVLPDKVLFVVILKACANLMSPEQGWEVHAYTVEFGLDSDPQVGSTLIFMHVELGSLNYAQTVFDKIKEPSVVAWNTLIMGYAEEGLSKEAFALFRKMQEISGLDYVTFLNVLKACISSEDLIDGMDLHAHAIASGLDFHLFVGSSLVDMYAKCGGIEHAYAVFNKLEERNVVSWTAMITGFAQQGMWDLTLDLFEQMQLKDAAHPNELTYASVLCACSGLCLEEKGRVIHSDIVKCGYELDVFIGSTLIDVYANCSCLDDAYYTFSHFPSPNTITYNSMLSGYAQQGLGEEALQLLKRMERVDLRPDEATFTSVLKACSFVKALEHGKQLHLQIVKEGIELNPVVAGSLVIMYSRCGTMEDAQGVFEDMPQKDTALWNELIAGYSLHGPWQLALSLLERMQHDGYEPNTVTFVSVLKACANRAALDQGQLAFMHSVKIGIGLDILIDSTLVDFFAKCGCLEDAAYIFGNMHAHDVVSYTAMITAYAQQGRAEDAISVYEQMNQEGVQPNEITFLSVLNACSHAGLVHEALQYFKSMKNIYGITPSATHCACLIDLLGRAGHHVEAMDLMSYLPPGTDEVPWIALLGSCRSTDSSGVARHSADHILQQSSENAAAYVLLSNISAA